MYNCTGYPLLACNATTGLIMDQQFFSLPELKLWLAEGCPGVVVLAKSCFHLSSCACVWFVFALVLISGSWIPVVKQFICCSWFSLFCVGAEFIIIHTIV